MTFTSLDCARLRGSIGTRMRRIEVCEIFFIDAEVPVAASDSWRRHNIRLLWRHLNCKYSPSAMPRVRDKP